MTPFEMLNVLKALEQLFILLEMLRALSGGCSSHLAVPC